MYNPYNGALYTQQEVLDAVCAEENRVEYRKCRNLYQEAAGAIAAGKIIGWFQGCSEAGPRALGNRSILADPRNPEMKDILNSRVKFREAFRPFAPSVLFEYQEQYFDLSVPSPYMLMVAEIWPRKRKEIPAVTHIDGTGRIQTVMKEMNPAYYSLISAFHKLTGIPIVLNTSFNINKEPIVESPGDALRCFLSTDLDELFLGSYRVTKK